MNVRSKSKRRVLVLSALILGFGCTFGIADAQGNGFFNRDIYVTPTEYVTSSWYLPTTSVVSTARVVPTYYATSWAPRRYLATSYSYVAAPRVYAPVAVDYVETVAYLPRPTRFQRRYGYLPTAYVYPSTSFATLYAEPETVFETFAEVPSPSDCCVTEPAPCDTPTSYAVAPSVPGTAGSEFTPVAPAKVQERAVTGPKPPKSVQSGPANKEPRSSAVDPRSETRTNTTPGPTRVTPPNEPDETPAATEMPQPEDIKAAETGSDPSSPPPPTPAPEIDKPDDSGTNTAAPPVDPKAPRAPMGTASNGGSGQGGRSGNGTGTTLRNSMKPVVVTAATSKPFARSLRDGTLHVLEGKVVSGATGELESGVRVTVANRRQTFADRTSITDADGRYKVRLPDGDWTVSVTTKSGKVYPVSEVVVSHGEITDAAGETIPTLTITR